MSMWILILTLLINFYVLYLWRRRTKNVEKYKSWIWLILLPTDIVAILFFTFIGAILSILFIYESFPLNKKRTIKEMEAIEEAIIRFNGESSRYPYDIQELLGNNPLKKDWEADYWGNKYRLIKLDESYIQLTSDGEDGEAETDDDIRIKI